MDSARVPSEPAVLPDELEARIRSLAKEWGVEIPHVQLPTDDKSYWAQVGFPKKLTHWVEVKSGYYPAQHRDQQRRPGEHHGVGSHADEPSWTQQAWYADSADECESDGHRVDERRESEVEVKNEYWPAQHRDQQRRHGELRAEGSNADEPSWTKQAWYADSVDEWESDGHRVDERREPEAWYADSADEWESDGHRVDDRREPEVEPAWGQRRWRESSRSSQPFVRRAWWRNEEEEEEDCRWEQEALEHKSGLQCLPPDPSRNAWHERHAQQLPDERTPEEREQFLQEEINRNDWYSWQMKERAALPIAKVHEQLLQAVSSKRVTLVAAETGSGKSTQVPQYILDGAIARGEGQHCHVVCTQPRRLAAMSLAERVSWERGGKYSHPSVGHVVRWDEKPPRPWGSICFCTVGALLPRLGVSLGVSHIVVDEAHTRDIHTDLLLAVLPQLLRNSPHLKILIMSATFDVHKLFKHFGGEEHVAIVEASGRPFRVKEYFLEDIICELSWRPPPYRGHDESGKGGPKLPYGAFDQEDLNKRFSDPEGAYPPSTLETVRQLDECLIQLPLIAAVMAWVAGWSREGGVLVFLPGWQEIAACADMLTRDPSLSRRYEIVRLHSTVPPGEQQRALWPSRTGKRKAILSTDIAETSITVPDVICVVDSGVARVKMHSSLEVMWASQANITQRSGRAGRVQDGVCVHLFTRARFATMDKEPKPEIQRVALEEVVLSVCDLGLDYCSAPHYQENSDPPGQAVAGDDGGTGNAGDDSWGTRAEEWSGFNPKPGAHTGVWNFLSGALDKPEESAVRHSFSELQVLGALDDRGYLTHLGALLARLPLPPALGSALLLGGLLGAPESASFVCAALSEREPWVRRGKESDCEEIGASAAAAFARGEDGQEIWSDAFTAASALRAFTKAPKSASSFCAEKALILPVMQQMQSAKHQLFNTLRDFKLVEQAAESSPSAASDTPPPAQSADTLESRWPLMQTMMTFAFGWNLGILEGGRRVQAGWRRNARLAKNSVLVDADLELANKLVVYEEMASGSGGRVLRGVTSITQLQALLFGGGRDGVDCEADECGVVGKWLRVPSRLSTLTALSALRSVTRLALQEAARVAVESRRRSWSGRSAEDELVARKIAEWRACVCAVAELPAAPPLEYVAALARWCPPQPQEAFAPVPKMRAWSALSTVPKLGSWGSLPPQESPPQVQAFSPVPKLGTWSSTSSVPKLGAWGSLPPQESPPQVQELPIGWVMDEDPSGKKFYTNIATGEARWERPTKFGGDGSSDKWCWFPRIDGTEGRRYTVLTDHNAVYARLVPPQVGDGMILPAGWNATWDVTRLRHYYWCGQAPATWDFPTHPVRVATALWSQQSRWQ